MALPRSADNNVDGPAGLVPASEVLIVTLSRRPFPRLSREKGLRCPIGLFLAGYVFGPQGPENVLFFDLSLAPRRGAYGRVLDAERHVPLIEAVNKLRHADHEDCLALDYKALSSMFLTKASRALKLGAEGRSALDRKFSAQRGGTIVEIIHEDADLVVGIGSEGEVQEAIVIPGFLLHRIRPWVVRGNRVQPGARLISGRLTEEEVLKAAPLLYEGGAVRLCYLECGSGRTPPIDYVDLGLSKPSVTTDGALKALGLWELAPRFQSLLD